MELLQAAVEGFKTIEADAKAKESAREHLGRWLADAEFAAYRPQLEWLIAEKKWGGLLDRFYQILPFGTGGRRGAVGIGPNRMNLWTLGASVQGHCEYLKERFPNVQPLQVALAYDVRQFQDKNKNYNPNLPNPVLGLSSKLFAQHAARIYVANGIDAWILPENSTRYLATPELSYAIRELRCHGGLNISASHNPPDDNGGKFYNECGAQPVPPDDQIMADLVDEVKVIKDLPWAEAVRGGKVHWIEESLHKGYIELCRKQSLIPPPRVGEIQIVFTPLHGVGSMTAMEALVDQGFRVRSVEEQMKPDGQFPNVTKSPNPEVPESLDRAEALAKSIGADLVLATDPDADRLGGLAVEADGSYRFLSGNILAALLTHFKLRMLQESGTMPKQALVITTLVTTGMITRITRHFGAQIVNNLLVGFKYHADVLQQLEERGRFEDVTGTPADFVLASEESHGVMVTPKIRDKDAGGGCLLMAELALHEKRNGSSVVAYIDRLEKQFGYFKNDLRNLQMPGIEGRSLMLRRLDQLRKSPLNSIGDWTVTGFEDLLDPNGRLGPIKGNTDASSRNLLNYQLGASARLALRPSGTEPKAKVYIEICSAPKPASMSEEAWKKQCRDVDAQAKKLGDDFVALFMKG
jgi:phosphoglucomutase/phosphomannomutase